jgi:periplasmic divalent cation tolerance protein
VIGSESMSGNAVVFCTAGSEAEASRIAAALVERRLAACVNVVAGISSTYRWEGAIRTDAEWLLIVKTRRDRFEEVRAAIRELHSYELPEIVMLDIAAGDPAYLAWIDANLDSK